MTLAAEQVIGTPALMVQFALNLLAKFKKKIKSVLMSFYKPAPADH